MNGPEFDDLIGADVPAGERERLLSAHEALLTAGPPAELPPGLEQAPNPEPKRPIAAAPIASLSSSSPPKASSIALPSAPPGSPPPSGLMISQKSVWLACPPTLLRTAVRMLSGMISSSASTASTGRSAHSVPSSALLALST